MKNGKVVAVNKVSMWCSIMAILVCIGWIIYEFLSKENDYALWIILLLLNVSVLFSNMNNKNE